jgi:hypothetical protein
MTTVVLPREVGGPAPAVERIGVRARSLWMLQATKARVPRFGVLTIEAQQEVLKAPAIVRALLAAQADAVDDPAVITRHADGLARLVGVQELGGTVLRAIADLLGSFAATDRFVVRPSLVGDLADVAATTGMFDSAIHVSGTDVGAAVLRLYVMAFHPRHCLLRAGRGLDPYGAPLAIVVQRFVDAEVTGVVASLDVDGEAARPRVRLWASPGLGGGLGGRVGHPRFARDDFFVDRPDQREQLLAEDAHVDVVVADKTTMLMATAQGTRMASVAQQIRQQPCVPTEMVRAIANEALRLEAVLQRTQLIRFAVAGGLVHVLDAEPLVVVTRRIDGNRPRSWDDRLVPQALRNETVSPLSFSMWQRGLGRATERAGRLLGVRGLVLEEVRPLFARLIGRVEGRVYGRIDTLGALLDLMPYPDKVRAAAARALDQPELLKEPAVANGFWARQRAKRDDSRYLAHLDKCHDEAVLVGDEWLQSAQRTSDGAVASKDDPDVLADRADHLEEALGKAAGAGIVAGLLAAQHMIELESALQELADDSRRADVAEPVMLWSLLAGDEQNPLLRGLQAMAQLVRTIDDNTTTDVERMPAAARQAWQEWRSSPTTSWLLEQTRWTESPQASWRLVLATLQAGPLPVATLLRDAAGVRTKAEWHCEQALQGLPTLKANTQRKRLSSLLQRLRGQLLLVARAAATTDAVIASLRQVALVLGDRLVEAGCLDQASDVFFVSMPEALGLVGGTGLDGDLRHHAEVRRRTTKVNVALSARVETRGMVSTSIGTVVATPMKLRPGVPGQGHGLATDNAAAVWVCRAPAVELLSTATSLQAVVASEAGWLSPGLLLLRSLGIPTVLGGPPASGHVVVDGSVGVVSPVDAPREAATRVGAGAFVAQVAPLADDDEDMYQATTEVGMAPAAAAINNAFAQAPTYLYDEEMSATAPTVKSLSMTASQEASFPHGKEESSLKRGAGPRLADADVSGLQPRQHAPRRPGDPPGPGTPSFIADVAAIEEESTDLLTPRPRSANSVDEVSEADIMPVSVEQAPHTGVEVSTEMIEDSSPVRST